MNNIIKNSLSATFIAAIAISTTACDMMESDAPATAPIEPTANLFGFEAEYIQVAEATEAVVMEEATPVVVMEEAEATEAVEEKVEEMQERILDDIVTDAVKE